MVKKDQLIDYGHKEPYNSKSEPSDWVCLFIWEHFLYIFVSKDFMVKRKMNLIFVELIFCDISHSKAM